MMTRLYLRLSKVQELCFVVEHHCAFDSREKKILRELAQIVPDGKVTAKPTLLGRVVQIGPRMSMKTPWSSSAVEAISGCGIRVERFEMLRRYAVPSGVDKHVFAATLFDRMTEEVYGRNLTTFERPVEIARVEIVPVLQKGKDALREISTVLGLGFDEQDIDIYYHLFADIMERNPTNAEIFALGQVNSNHCRHLDWNGIWTIDGQVQEKTLFQLIKMPYQADPGNALVAFHDNSCVIKGFPVKMALPKYPWKSSEYVIVTVHADGTLTFETHNHPTGVAAYPGAGTGTGGRMRDGKAVGRGGLLRAACAGFMTGNLNIPGDCLPWERKDYDYPENLMTARKIQIAASDGACDYNNPVGEPVILGVKRAVDMATPDGVRRAWLKPIMASGGIGIVRHEHVEKCKPRKGWWVVAIGGPAYDVGFGGGSASSQVSGQNKAHLDFKSVQRADPEKAIRDHRVIDACVAMGLKNPIKLIHDQGAGGVINNLMELVELLGAVINAGKINLGDKYLPFIVRLGAEFQERYGLVVKDLKTFRKICRREKCSMEVLGQITGDGRFVVCNNIKGDHKKPIDFDLKTVLAELPPKKFSDNHVDHHFPALVLPHNITIMSALNRVLRNRAVGAPEDLVLKGDRSVSGLVVRQQMCGPSCMPVADNGIVALSQYSKEGMAFSMGENPLKMMVNPAAGARMTASEGILNIASALVTSRGDINSSANWMWAVKYPGDAAALFDAEKALSTFMVGLGKPIRGKDSSSMNTKFNGKNVPAPRELILTMYAMMRDCRKFVTPDIKQPGKSNLLFLDLGFGKNRMGGTILGQCYNQWGNDCPDIEARVLANAFDAIQELIRQNLLLSYHDRSDGGLITTLLEMIFSGNCGLCVNLKSRDIIPSLFSEEAGAVIEVDPENCREVMGVLGEFNVPVKNIGNSTVGKNTIIYFNGRVEFAKRMVILRQIWRETGYQLRRLQMNPDAALAEKMNTKDRKGISYFLPPGWDGRLQYRICKASKHQPKVAILSEVGTNSRDEMVHSFKSAGFDAVDVEMSDLENGSVKNLNRFSVLAACGGFANRDTFGSARAWAIKTRYNPKLFRILWEFMKIRQDTLSYFVCNGHQYGTSLGWLPYLPEDGIPVDGHPVLTYNASRKFEARWLLVKVGKSPAIMTRGLEGCVLGVNSAHGEGRLYCRDRSLIEKIDKENLSPIRFVDDNGVITEEYPFNPSGSPLGMASLCSPDGRHFGIMPHLERSVQFRQWEYLPEDLKKFEFAPWHLCFENMRKWFR